MFMKKEKFRLFLSITLSVALTFGLLGNVSAAAETSDSEPFSTTQGNTGGDDTSKSDSATDVGVTEVEVTESKGEQVARDANIGVLGDKDVMDTPFNVTSYTEQTIEDQQADTLYDVLIVDPSVRFTTSNGHNNENYKIRGLDVNFQHLYFNGMPGLAPHYHVPVEFLEQVEVLKGPSSFLYGGVSTSVGGVINLVPKRAGEEDITNFTTNYTSDSHFGGHLDIGRRFGENKEWGVRFNGLYADGETGADGQSKERLLGTLGVDYRKDKLRLSLDAYSSEESYDNGSTSMYTFSSAGYVEAPDGSTNIYQGTYGTSRNDAVLFKGEYDLQDNLIAYAGIGRLSSDATGLINGNHVLNLGSDGTATARNVFKQYFWTETTSSELGLRGEYLTGDIKHQLVLGANFMDTDYSNAFAQGTGNYPTNIYNPISLVDEFNLVQQPGKGNQTQDLEVSSIVLSDTLSFVEDKVELTLGVRQQNVDQIYYKYSNNLATGTPTLISTKDADATSPLIGLIVKPWGESISLYANYIEALSPGATVLTTTLSNYGEMLDPYKTKQREVGVKWDKGNFVNTLALFQIEMPNTMTANNIQSYDGEQRNSGIEWNTFGSVAKNLRLLGGIAYTHGELVHTAAGANDGNTPFGVPEWTVNAGIEWDTLWNRDLTLSLRGIYTGSQYINSTNTIEIPSWIRWDIGAQYKSVIYKTPVIFRAGVENLFDENYWAGCFNENYVTLGASRTIKLSATMQF